MQDKQVKELLQKYQAGNATEEEIAFLESWYLLHNESDKTNLPPDELLKDAAEVWNKLSPAKRSIKLNVVLPWLVAAASILLLFYFGSRRLVTANTKKGSLAKNKTAPIVPGGNKAVLTLANGSTVILTGSGNGQLVKQGNTSINQTASGKLVYTIGSNAGAVKPELVYNTITTPMGGQYWVVLCDGTKVFLNAGTTLRYPVSFIGNERKVELKGEAYFEVVHNSAAPFRIVSAGQVIEDIGTKFNINAYDDEPVIKTTLIEGAVKVSASLNYVVLKPGEQTQINIADAETAIKVINHVNLNEVLAWKNGLFEFDNSTLKEVMNSTARWYNFKVSYESKIPDIKISGRISRNVDFSGLIALLKFEGVKFSIEGRNVTIKN